MMPEKVELALGTAQFGLKYGIVGCGQAVPEQEVRQIFSSASAFGIRVIDTASAYGDIEQRLNALVEDYPFDMVSKIPAIPRDKGFAAVSDFVAHSILKSREYLGERLSTILFHRGQDLLDQYGDLAWKVASEVSSDLSIRLGVSCYSPQELAVLSAKFPIKVAQIPGNALDQRLISVHHFHEVELHLRSVFLQGILLSAPETVAMRLPRATKATDAWRNWCLEHDVSLLQGALSLVKGLPGVRYCVVGVDSVAQLENIFEAWVRAVPIQAHELAIQDEDLIDPRRWSIDHER